ncbi:MAG: hypothetical protein HKO98_12595 [Gemmatimonadetes bacterium]|nr:hypothetical protein [Gemmatimonadota bacterium]
MRARVVLTALVLVAPLTACAGSGSGTAGPSAPPALAYAMPPGGAVTYLQSDTVEMVIDMGGQLANVTVEMGSTLDMTFSGGGDALEVTATFREFELSATNPLAGTQRADESQIDGPLVFTIDRTGAGTLVSAPQLGEIVSTGLSPASMAAGFFPRLPARAVSAGEMWTDTVSIDAVEDYGTTRGRTVYDFHAVGDTVVDGRTYLKVAFTSFDERVAQSQQMGTDIIQDVAGEGVGYYLWDAARNLVVEQSIEGRLEGSMEVSMAPAPLGIDMVVVQHLKLVEGN